MLDCPLEGLIRLLKWREATTHLEECAIVSVLPRKAMASSTDPIRLRALVLSNALIQRLRRNALGTAVGAAVAGLAIADSQAQAIVVSVGDFDYDVTTFTGSYNDNESKFNTPANGGAMPWWENYNHVNNWTTNLASDFALEAEYSLGSGVLFAYELRPQYNSTQAAFYIGINILFGTETLYDSSATWAQATFIGPTNGGGGVSADVPGPLPGLGLAAAFGFSRKLRKRIKASSNTVSSTRGA
jgi:hypothetical protein